ncbi:DoxX family protein [Teredinibacter purpureus]|uniref:DoxX family protein n=1 Tax=Teredinibacter purpureus TaxID=2731756 RepID=UPI0005F826A1|nr:DoxX family protein [Teredinibacter purpureus]
MQHTIQLLSAPIGRILLALIFVTSGYSKIGAYEGTQGWMESMGVPGALLPIAIVVEIVGGLAIMIGWHTRVVALLMAGFTVVSALLFHNDFSNQSEMINFMKNLSIAGGFLLLVSSGAGAFSLDSRTAKL